MIIIKNPKNINFENPIDIKLKLEYREFLSGLFRPFSVMIILIVFFPLFGLMNYFNPYILKILNPNTTEVINLFSIEYFSKHIISLIFILLPFLFYFKMKKFFKKSPISKGISYLFEKETVKITSDNSETITKLSVMNKIIITDKLILFYSNRITTIILPKRVFKSNNELNYFIQIINKNYD